MATEIIIKLNKKQLDALSPKLKSLGVDFQKLGKQGKRAGDKMAAGFNKAGSGARKLERETTRLRQSSTGLAGSLGALRNKLLVFGFATAGTVTLIKKVITEASKLEESINAVNVVFGVGAETILKFGKNAARSVGLANSDFNQLSTVTGALLRDVGIPLKEVADLTNTLTIRASDLASVFDTNVRDALSAINQALRGETEAIRRYAGDVTDATLETFALAEGIDKQVSSMDQQEKRLLRVKLIMSQTASVEGDFEKTHKSFANQTRILNSTLSNTAATIGSQLLPPLSKLLFLTNTIVKDDGVLEKFATRAQRVGEIFAKINPLVGLYVRFIDSLDEPQKKAAESADKLTKNLRSEASALVALNKAEKEKREAIVEKIIQENLEIKKTNFLTGQTVEKLEARRGKLFDLTELQAVAVVQGRETLDIITKELEKVQEITDEEKRLKSLRLAAEDNRDALNLKLSESVQLAQQFTNSLAQSVVFGRDLKSTFLSIASSLINFGIGKLFNPSPVPIAGFAHGGQFRVGGQGGTDSQFVGFNATPGETVTVTPANQTTNNNSSTISISLNLPNVKTFDKFTVETQLMPLIREALDEGEIL
ncbi:hypothetical protein LCGC14_1665010 [marine sediment metagenome]|uniref:Bacteriophage tail tape measure N-terminal domain-containing protein n=1 Tax=marine sediment metagenome TaxID=412755 RepID=A0A0F9HTS0_9ZZZZ